MSNQTLNITIIRACQPIPEMAATAGCIGNFDGLHIGHQQLVEATVAAAAASGAIPALITFNPDPRTCSNQPVEYLTSLADRIRLAGLYGIKQIYVLQFDQAMRTMSAERFVEKILKKLNLKTLVFGFDFSFGAGGQGNGAQLQQWADGGFETVVVPQVSYEGHKVSTTAIINLIHEGRIDLAEKLLGRPWIQYGDADKDSGMFKPNVSYAALPDGLYQAECRIHTNLPFEKPQFRQDDITVEIRKGRISGSFAQSGLAEIRIRGGSCHD